ncbi:MAG: putative type modification methyltransferase, subunit [Sphingobacteriaceae bacterium]|jgi:hypothetical protein|nr:putative type modification methyltransferase, subunit [Sphingobacteriaceae bacterium]
MYKSNQLIPDLCAKGFRQHLADKSLADLDNLPDPDVLAEEIAENLESALESFREMIAQLKK